MALSTRDGEARQTLAQTFNVEVMVDFVFLMRGADIRAVIDGVECGRVVNAITPPSELWPNLVFGTFYIVQVASEEETPGCGGPGKRIQWSVNGRPTDQETPWSSGEDRKRITITVGGVPMILTGRIAHAEGLAGDEPAEITIGGYACGRAGFGRAAPTGVGGVDAYGAIVLPYTADPHCGRDGDRVQVTIGGRAAIETVIWREGRATVNITLADPPAKTLAAPAEDGWEWLALGLAAGAAAPLLLVGAGFLVVRRLRS